MNKEITPLKLGLLTAGIVAAGLMVKHFYQQQPKGKLQAQRRKAALSLEQAKRISTQLRYSLFTTAFQVY